MSLPITYSSCSPDVGIDKKLVFDGKSIRKERDRIKKKNRAKGKGTGVAFKEKGILLG
jgi:hypothetical protein